MERHARQVRPGQPTARRGARLQLRVLGGLLLVGALWASIVTTSLGIGMVFWLGVLSLASPAIAGLLTYAPTWLPRIAAATAAMAVMSLVITALYA